MPLTLGEERMDSILEFLARFAFKGALRSLFRTPFGQWGVVQWAIVAGLVAVLAGVAYFVFRHGARWPLLGRKKGRRRPGMQFPR